MDPSIAALHTQPAGDANPVAASRGAGGALAAGERSASPGPDSPKKAAVPKPEAKQEQLASQERGEERELRHAFADATEVTEPALKLASFLVRKERHPEALHVVDLAIQRQRTPGLRMARAGLLRDVARNDLAMVELRGVVRERGRQRVAAGTLFELAQVEWLAGDRDAAQATMRDLLRIHVDGPFLRENAEQIRAWHERIENATLSSDGGDLRDAFALLRAAPVVTGRLRILNALARPAPDDTEDGRRPVRLRAIGIGCADESAAVRTRAVQLADANALHNLSFWRAAMADASPLVRRFGAYGCVHQHGKQAAKVLLEAISNEDDPAAFAGMHAAMAQALSVEVPPCAAETDVGRNNAVAMWRQRCGQ